MACRLPTIKPHYHHHLIWTELLDFPGDWDLEATRCLIGLLCGRWELITSTCKPRQSLLVNNENHRRFFLFVKDAFLFSFRFVLFLFIIYFLPLFIVLPCNLVAMSTHCRLLFICMLIGSRKPLPLKSSHTAKHASFQTHQNLIARKSKATITCHLNKLIIGMKMVVFTKVCSSPYSLLWKYICSIEG